MTVDKLKNLTLLITDGKHGDCENADNSGFYFVSCKDIHDGIINYSDARQITEQDFAETHRRTQLQPNDILITNSGTIGRMALVKDIPETARTTFQKSVAIIKPDTSKIIPAYLYYCLLNRVTDFVNNSNGSAQKNLLLGTMRDFTIQYYEQMAKQETVISIIKPFDDFIETNQRQIKLLEEAAQRLYKEWFVDLRFPGHENVPMVDGVPEGWTKVNLCDVSPIVTGKKDANFGTVDGQFKFFTCAQEPIKAPTYSFDCEAVILAGNGDFNVKLYRGKFEAYQRTYVFSPYDAKHLFILYHSVCKNMQQLFTGASGSTIKFLTKHMLEAIQVLIPSCDILNSFNRCCSALLEKQEFLFTQNADAREARDRLLPKLMSGEIAV